MDFLLGSMHRHIEGHKAWTLDKEIIDLTDLDTLAVPLVHGNRVIEPMVKVGDEVKIGHLLGARNDHFYVPVTSPISGKVIGIEKRALGDLKNIDHIIIENDHQDAKEDLPTITLEASKEELVAFMKDKGLIGCGGAGFPTYAKYQTDQCHTLIINAVECEPYITSDLTAIKLHKEAFHRGVLAFKQASLAKEVLIAIKEEHHDTIKSVKELFINDADITVRLVRDVYPMGWERTLVYTLLHKRYAKLPIEVNAIVSNATTAIMMGRMMEDGLPIYEKIVTVSGDGIKDPHNVLCRIGTPFAKLIEACGGYKEADGAYTLVAGGPMMGKISLNEAMVTTPELNALTVSKVEAYDTVACLNCGACVDHCPANLQPVNINKAFKSRDWDLLAKLKADDCIECGLCSYVCPSKIEVTEGVKRAKKLVMARKK